MLRYLSIVSLLVVIAKCHPAAAQIRNVVNRDTRKKDIVDVLKTQFKKAEPPKEKPTKIEKVKQANKKVYISFFPVSSQKRGGKKVFVSSVNSAFYLGKSDSTYLSHTFLEPSTNFSNKFGIGYRFNLWTKDNKWNIPGDINITNLDQFTWGLGAATSNNDKFRIATKYLKFYFNLNKDWHSTHVLFYGIGLNYDRYYNLAPDIAPITPDPFEKYGIGTNESLYSAGISFNILYDTRRNSANPAKGIYTTAIFRTNPSVMGNSLLWSSLYLDARRYIPLSSKKRKILALWAMYWGTYGQVPYLNLPATSMDLNGQSGRGFNYARFRGKEMLYAEAEYRFDLMASGLLGGVIFCNVQSFTEPDTNQFTYALPSIGLGARIKLNKSSNTNLGLDFAMAKDGLNFSAVLGEAF